MPPSDSYRQRATATFLGADDPPADQIRDGLQIGREYLGVGVGFLTRIDGGTQEIVYATGDHPQLQPGEQCPLDEAYCQRTVETEGTLSVQAAGATDTIPDPAVDRFGLGTYVGAKITVGDDLYGTICFADSDARAEPFTETEELFVELLAERIGNTLKRRADQAALARQNERLQAEKRRFEGIARASPDIIFRIDDETAFSYLSPAVERLLGYEPDALIGESFLDLLADASTEPALDLYRRVRGGETVDGVELDVAASDGSVRVFEVNARPVDGPDGDTSVQGTARDITDRKARQRELETKTRAMDEADIGIVIADATREDNAVTYVNDGFCALTGYDREAVLGSNCRFLQGEATDPDTVARLRRAIAAEEAVSVDIVNYRASGYAFWNEVSITPVENDAGEVVQYVGFQQDVTDRKRRQRLLDVMNRVLRHNLRNKMCVILGALDASEDDFDRSAAIETAAGTLLSLADRAREIYAYTQTDPEPDRLAPVELFEAASATVIEDYPDADLDVAVETDRAIAAGGELRAAIAELIENALLHDPAPETAVTLSAHDDGAEVVLTVADDGPGIEDMETAVVNAGRESPLEHGSGLGLWFVNWVVTRYGGAFAVTERADDESGTVATIRLPAVGPEQDVDAAARRPTILGE